MMMDDNPEETVYGLIMPFVVCTSQGGAYDDGAFVAGVRFGRWVELLKLKPTQHSNYEPKDLVPQLDLLAMQHHYRMASEPYEDDPENYWVYVTMILGDEDG